MAAHPGTANQGEGYGYAKKANIEGVKDQN
jgi:hypothetical protein